MKALWALTLLLGCSQGGATSPRPSHDAKAAASAVVEVQPGTVRWVRFTPPAGYSDAILRCRGQAIKHAAGQHGERYAYVAESYFSDLGKHSCALEKGMEKHLVLFFNVVHKDFPSERLRVDFRKIKLSPKDQERAAREQVMLNALYQRSAPLPYFSAPFKLPLDSTITSIYGSQRLYNKKHRSQHLGTDFRAAIGLPVPVANRGRVLFAGDLFYTGGTVIVDHGMDIFTFYGHLSEVKARDGEVVNLGDVIGLAGNTGRSSGPHLHWGVKIHGNYVDGHSLIEQTRIQFP